MDKFIFPAIFESAEEGGYCITFPDLPGCITEGDTLEESIRMARDALELFLWNMEEDEESIPNPTAPEDIEITNKCFVMPIEVYMPPVREEMNNKAVKKTLTIPYWLNRIAEKEKINFSQLLQNAIKQQLNLKNHK